MTEATRHYAQPAYRLPPGAKEVILVRHGASAHVVPGERFLLTDGWGDPPLAPEGEQQAAAVARRLFGEQVAGVFVSGLRRTLQTAAPLVAHFGVEPVVVPELREVHVGDWEGGEFRIRVAKGDPLAVRVFEEERWDIVPNGEPMEAFSERVRKGVEAVLDAAAPDTSVVAILHAGVIAEICRQATASRPFAFVHVENGSLTRLVVLDNGSWVLRTFNDTVHVDGGPPGDPPVPV